MPLFPLSRETARFEQLKRSRAFCRLVFGQPRKKDLLRRLRQRSPWHPAALALLAFPFGPSLPSPGFPGSSV